MRRRSWLPFIILNVVISAGVALGLFSALQQNAPASQQIVTPLIVEIVVTATRDPNATEAVRIITATPLPGTVIAGIPTGILETPNLTAIATIDPAQLEGDTALQGTATALPPGCILHTLQEGEFPSSVAALYGADVFDLMAVNGLDEESATFLQVGQALIVPLEGCPLTIEDIADIATPAPEDETVSIASADEATEESTAEVTDEATVRPTLTLPPTATDAQVEIVEIVNAGDVTAEGVVIRNTGSTVNMTGWTLTDTQGNTFTFPEQLLFSNASVTVFTRIGQNTPVALYWGQNEAMWGDPGDVATLTDADGDAQSIYRLESPVELR